MSIGALAEASVETTEVFLSSHITLRAPIVSIYVNEDSETTDSVCTMQFGEKRRFITIQNSYENTDL